MKIDFPLDLDLLESTADTAHALREHVNNVYDRFVLLTGSTISREYAGKLISNNSLIPIYTASVAESTINAVYSVEREIRANSPNAIIAIGGGRVCDFAKRLSYITNLPLVLIPTIIANDGLISPISVLHDGGRSVSLAGRMPDTILIDLEVIRKAPFRYLRSAACDLITNLSATHDWERASAGEEGRMHHLAQQMSRMAAHQVLNNREWAHSSPSFLRAIVYGQMLSGISMALAGSSRPCSGSEHLIAHSLDALSLGRGTLHGETVGITSRFCLQLQGSTEPKVEDFFAHFCIPRVFPGCDDFDRMQMMKIFATARKMRPGRATILDSYTDEELSDRYLAFITNREVSLA